jgi:hypothetical protein
VLAVWIAYGAVELRRALPEIQYTRPVPGRVALAAAPGCLPACGVAGLALIVGLVVFLPVHGWLRDHPTHREHGLGARDPVRGGCAELWPLGRADQA